MAGASGRGDMSTANTLPLGFDIAAHLCQFRESNISCAVSRIVSSSLIIAPTGTIAIDRQRKCFGSISWVISRHLLSRVRREFQHPYFDELIDTRSIFPNH
jgi:hypothetical protein